MKNNSCAFVGYGLGAVALFLTSTASGQEFFLPERETGFYMKVDVGPAWTEDVKVKEFLGTPNIGSFKFDTGVRFDAGFGYQFNRWVAAEFESGVIYNSIRQPGDSSYSSVPLMVNAVFTAPISSRFVPFAGIGGGGVVGVLDARRLGSPSLGFIDGSDSDAVWAWQGFAGLRYVINNQFNVSLAYRYLGSAGPSWDVESGPPFFGPTEKIKFDDVHSHAVVLGVNFSF